jgi:hypothetical protein
MYFMSIFDLCKKTIAVLLLAFAVSTILPACSSDSEEAPAEIDCDNPANADEAEKCLSDLPI